MNADRFAEITGRFSKLRVALIGDFCLDRYLEIDPARAERSIETGLGVLNVARVRSQPGGCGTILNNLAALGVGTVYPVGFAGNDGEGYELMRALGQVGCVDLGHFFQTPARRTFSYTKPLVMEPGQSPRELNRLDFKNWIPTPEAVQERIAGSLAALAKRGGWQRIEPGFGQPNRRPATQPARQLDGESPTRRIARRSRANSPNLRGLGRLKRGPGRARRRR